MKAHLVFEIDIHDAEHYAGYVADAPAIVERHGGRYLVRGGRVEPLEGNWAPQRFVVIEFPSLSSARAFYESEDYQRILPTRIEATQSRGFIVQGI